MSTARRIEIALGILGLCTGLAFAQAPGGNPPGGPGGPGGPPQGSPGGRGGHRGERSRPRLPLLTALDINGDGVIDAGEIAGAPAALKTLDKNGDGRLTRDEYLPERPEGQGPGEGPGGGAAMDGPGGEGGPGGGMRNNPLVKALDASGDGVIDAAEITNARAELKALDLNRDGSLSGEEIHPARPEGQGSEGGPGGGPEEQGRASIPTGRSGYGSGATRPWAPKSASGVPSDAPPEEAPRAAAAASPSPSPTTPAAPIGEEPLSVTGVASFSNPLRLTVSGSGFQAGCTVQVNGKPVPDTAFRGSHMAVAEGAGLEGLLPKGSAVHITVVNPDGGVSSPLVFTR